MAYATIHHLRFGLPGRAYRPQIPLWPTLTRRDMTDISRLGRGLAGITETLPVGGS
jgi:hypothetical protein